MKKLSLRSILLGGSIVLFVPLICYFILRSAGHTGHVKVPGNFGIDTVIEKTVEGKTVYDTVFHTIQDNSFISHLNDSVNLATDYPRKMLLINFFSTADTGLTKTLTYHMRHIQQGFKLKKTDTSLQLISIATQPVIDDVQAIRKFANEQSHDHDTWTFLTADTNQITDFAINELFLKEFNTANSKGNQNIVLVDKFRNIRAYYNGLDSIDIKRCIDDIAVMMVEKNKIHEKKKR